MPDIDRLTREHISLDATLKAIRLQILTDEARRAESPMRKLVELAQTYLLRRYY